MSGARALSPVRVMTIDDLAALLAHDWPRESGEREAESLPSEFRSRARGDRRITSQHILLGVLAAQHGTVPRALRLTGAEPAKLMAATHAGMRRS